MRQCLTGVELEMGDSAAEPRNALHIAANMATHLNTILNGLLEECQ